MEPVIDHIQITVGDIAQAEIFYDKLMPLLGFDLSKRGKGVVLEREFEAIEYVHRNIVIGINSPRSQFRDEIVHRRRPGSLHHLAFRAANRGEIDELFPLIRAIGARIIESPRFYPEHGPNYYALYFKDPFGIKLEIMHEERTS